MACRRPMASAPPPPQGQRIDGQEAFGHAQQPRVGQLVILDADWLR
jgi:hypothetical protein